MKSTGIYAILLLAALLLAGCTQQSQVNQAGNSGANKSFSLDEVAQHSSPSDCWMAINGNVYNLTELIAGSPMGKALEEGCGKEATALFESRPSPGNGSPNPDRNIMNRGYNAFRRDNNSFRPDGNAMRGDSNRFRQDGNIQRPESGGDMLLRFYLGALRQ